MIDRRSFVQGLSAAAITLNQARAVPAKGPGVATGNVSPVRLGIIGPGSRGKELVRSFLRGPGVTIVAAADVYEPRFHELDELCQYKVVRYKDAASLLAHPDLDAVIVATPLSFHAQYVIAALQSGRHVYGEKTMCFTLQEAAAIVSTLHSAKAIYQVGHQYRYAPWIRVALQQVRNGEIGDVTHIHGYWHRNSDWRRPVPDPSLERLMNWRLYNDYSLGLLAELGSHHIDIANWVFGEAPHEAFATGSIAQYHDGRENDDNVQAVLSYSKGRRFLFSSMTGNAKMGDQLWLYGTRGSLNLTLMDAEFFYEPRRIVHVKSGEPGSVVTGASYRPQGEMPYRGPGLHVDVPPSEDPTTLACQAFIYSVRTGQPPIADVQAGYRAAIAVITANQCLAAHKQIAITAEI